MAYTVKAVADKAGITIRTLHHYDDIGLLKPAAVSPSGYRLYTDRDLERLQQVLFFRELGFALEDIGPMIDSPSFDRRGALESHRKLLREQQRRIGKLIGSIDKTIDSIEKGTTMDTKAMFEGFDESKLEEYRKEAGERWGKDVVDESYRRYGQLTKAQKAKLDNDMKDLNLVIAGRMDKGPADAEVQKRVAQWHRIINDNFYACSPEVFRGLGEMYVEDKRFTAFYDKIKPGMAPFLRDAMRIYTDRLGKATK